MTTDITLHRERAGRYYLDPSETPHGVEGVRVYRDGAMMTPWQLRVQTSDGLTLSLHKDTLAACRVEMVKIFDQITRYSEWKLVELRSYYGYRWQHRQYPALEVRQRNVSWYNVALLGQNEFSKSSGITKTIRLLTELRGLYGDMHLADILDPEPTATGHLDVKAVIHRFRMLGRLALRHGLNHAATAFAEPRRWFTPKRVNATEFTHPDHHDRRTLYDWNTGYTVEIDFQNQGTADASWTARFADTGEQIEGLTERALRGHGLIVEACMHRWSRDHDHTGWDLCLQYNDEPRFWRGGHRFYLREGQVELSVHPDMPTYDLAPAQPAEFMAWYLDFMRQWDAWDHAAGFSLLNEQGAAPVEARTRLLAWAGESRELPLVAAHLEWWAEHGLEHFERQQSQFRPFASYL